MINRTLIRTRVIQTLYAYVEDGEMTASAARKQLVHSFDDTYSLYFLLLDLPYALTRYAQEAFEESRARARATHGLFKQSRNFIDNRFADTLFHSSSIQNELDKRKLSWDAAHASISYIYKQISESKEYAEYMKIEHPTFQDDKNIWKFIFTSILPNNEHIAEAMDELELICDASHWITDVDTVLSFVAKTLRTVKENEEVAVMPIFDEDDELNFATSLLDCSISHYDEYQELLASHLRGWDLKNIVFIDRIIITTALAEIVSCPEIPLQISLNEYIDLTREFSSEKSPTFVNGTLTAILKDLYSNGKLPKAANVR